MAETEEESNKLLKIFEAQNIVWGSGEKATSQNFWGCIGSTYKVLFYHINAKNKTISYSAQKPGVKEYDGIPVTPFRELFLQVTLMKNIENKTILMKYIELREGVSIEELLYSLYIEEEKSIREIAQILDINYHTVNDWLKQAEIETRLPYQKLLEVVQIKRKLEEK